ncbi:MAG: signal peptidase I [Acidimicrobiales bacterium]
MPDQPSVQARSVPPTEAARPRGAPARRPPSWKRSLLEWVAVVVTALVLALVIQRFFVQAFYIPSGSMEPTLMVGDRILVNKLAFDFHPVQPGDIVVFKRPPREVGPPQIKDLVKRVIGLPGQVIQSSHGQVLINGKVLPEPWLPRGTVTTGIAKHRIRPGHYWVMGDNRANSYDSRYFGSIPKSLIVGQVFFRIWPPSRIGPISG